MSRVPSVLFLLVGRGGSKGVPGKNLRRIGGLSLIGHKAIAAKKSSYCDRMIVSSDSAEIQSEAKRFGAEVLFTRPAELATDTASSNDVILHAIEWIEKTEGRSYDAIMLLEPSSPFASPKHFDEAVRLFCERDADLVVGMRETEISSDFVGTLGDDGSISTIVENLLRMQKVRRQDQKPEVTMNGALYLIRWRAMKETGKVYSNPKKSFGLVMDRLHSIEIETLYDLAFAEFAVERGLLDTSPWQT
ncbi:MAG: acylneuraminate cytidylyltransferase family protein [Xanthobacteraceae bacterium]|nr:acylneuraminate cytidylyltransferase family protein [Xanthobacteraceae bacterium]